MLIGLDAIPLTEPMTGVGHYTFELARALARVSPQDEFELVYPTSFPPLPVELRGGAPAEEPLPGNLRTARVSVGPVGRHWWSVGLPRYAGRAGYGLFHGTNYDVPLWGRCPSVVTIHDLSLFLHPETHERRRVRRARRRLPLMARRAAAVITPTESIRREVCEHLRIDEGRVFAVPEAPRAVFSPAPEAEARGVCERLGVGDDFLLAVGTIEPRKNLSALVSAFAAVSGESSRRGLRLALAGKKGWLTEELFAEVEGSGVRDRIVLTGYLPDRELRALYSACRLFIYPSLYEGFGLPPLEAMACGAPVVASSIPSLRETLGSAARLCDPRSPRDLAHAMAELLDDDTMRARLSREGRRRAAEFSWERTARMTLEVYGRAFRAAGKDGPKAAPEREGGEAE
jgi:glycosyltransferase involved in cell wall biosynthesis